MRRRRRHSSNPFTDLLFNALLGFAFLFIVAIALMNPVAKRGRVNLEAEFIVTLTWPENRTDDLDLWVEDPHGEVVSYLNRDAGWLHLDRDDRGDLNDTIEVAGERIVHPVNQEIVTLRGVVAGEYVVNVHYYDAPAPDPVVASVRIDKVNPELETVFFDRIRLDRIDDEHTAVRFTVSRGGDVVGLSRLTKRLTPYALSG